jgi:hypothetical protein
MRHSRCWTGTVYSWYAVESARDYKVESKTTTALAADQQPGTTQSTNRSGGPTATTLMRHLPLELQEQGG